MQSLRSTPYYPLLVALSPSDTMPYVDLVSSDDYAAIWYTTNAPACNVSGFDPAKPTLIMLHPLFLDSSWMHPQLDDPRLNANFNIIVFDLRTSGKSLYRPSGRYDLWVTAADLAHCFYVSSPRCSVAREDSQF